MQSKASAESVDEQEARQFFEQALRLRVERIPTDQRQTADFLVKGEEPGYVVEVKSRFDAEELERRLKAGQVASAERSMGLGRWTMDGARKARRQMRSIDPHHDRFWVLWYGVRCRLGTKQMADEVVGSLYGVRQIVYQGEEEVFSRDCLYAMPGVFERWPEFDGAFVSWDDQFTFCANELARTAEVFEASTLYRAFAARGGPVTARNLVESGYLKVDRSINRRDKSAVCRYLAEQYALKAPILLDVRPYIAAIEVPRSG